MTRIERRLYRALLWLLPPALRRECADDMLQMFRDYRRPLAGRPLRCLRLWVDATMDIMAQSRAYRAKDSRPRWFDVVSQDFAHGFRLLRRYRSTSWLAIVTLALGIGTNAAMFSVVDHVLVRALPYPEPDRLAMIWETRPAEGVLDNPVSPADFLDWRRLNTSFSHVAAYVAELATMTGGDESTQLTAGYVTSAFFQTLGTNAARGRTFVAADELFGSHRVLVLSHGLWQRRFGADPAVVGRTVALNGRSWVVVGVLPEDFQFIDPTVELWAPLVLEGAGEAPARASHFLQVYGRLKPGVSLDRAREDMARIGRQLEDAYPDSNRGHGAGVAPMRDHYVGTAGRSLIVLFAAVGFVLLIACVNVASLLVSRALSRGREMAVRTALGATRGRLFLQSLIESLALACAGGVASVAVAMLTLRLLPAVMPTRVSIVGIDQLQLDLRVLLFMAAVSIFTGVLFGVLPAVHASGARMNDALKSAGRNGSGARGRSRTALVVGEVALAALALMGAALAVRSFSALMAQPLGFATHGRVAMTVSLPPAAYPTVETQRAAMAEIEHRLTSVPGVRSVGATNILPLSGDDVRRGVTIEGREPVADTPTRIHPRVVTPTYFATLDIPIAEGRGFSAHDDSRAMPVAMVSLAAAQRFWPGSSPVGARVRLGTDDWLTVIGVTGNVKHWGLAETVNPVLYLPAAQAASDGLTYILESTGDPLSLATAVRAQILDFDRRLPVGRIEALDDVVSRSVRNERAQAVLMSAFGLLALALASVGIYGVMAQMVIARVQETGLRIALGAQPIHVLGALLREGLMQTALGLVLGLGVGLYLVRFMAALLFGINPWDPATLAAVALTVISAALTACLVPARRAMRVDPVAALRGTEL